MRARFPRTARYVSTGACRFFPRQNPGEKAQTPSSGGGIEADQPPRLIGRAGTHHPRMAPARSSRNMPDSRFRPLGDSRGRLHHGLMRLCLLAAGAQAKADRASARRRRRRPHGYRHLDRPPREGGTPARVGVPLVCVQGQGRANAPPCSLNRHARGVTNVMSERNAGNAVRYGSAGNAGCPAAGDVPPFSLYGRRWSRGRIRRILSRTRSAGDHFGQVGHF